MLLARKIYRAVREKCGESIVPTKDKITVALAEFEDEMLQRSDVKVKKSADAARFLHTDVAIAEGNITRGAAAVEENCSGTVYSSRAEGN